MEAREKLDEYAEMQGWDKNKLIGWSEAADFAEWLVKNLTIPPVIKSVCPTCKGSGEVQQTDVDWDECRRCNGTGQIVL